MLSGLRFEPSTSQRRRRNNSPFTTTFNSDCSETILCVGVSAHTCLCTCAHVHIFKVIFCVWILVSDTTYDLTAAKRVQFFSDRMSYVTQRGNWSPFTILNFCVPTENKSSDTKDSFCDELEHIFENCPKFTVCM